MRLSVWRSCMILIFGFSLLSCAGTIQSHVASPMTFTASKTAFIIQNECSNYIQNVYSLGDLVHMPHGSGSGTLPIPTFEVKDGFIYQDQKRGDTETHIKTALEKHGFVVYIGSVEPNPDDIDILIKYDNKWKWDIAWYLQYLKVSFLDPKTGQELAYGEFKNSNLHSFQTPKREVPKIIDAILKSNF